MNFYPKEALGLERSLNWLKVVYRPMGMGMVRVKVHILVSLFFTGLNWREWVPAPAWSRFHGASFQRGVPPIGGESSLPRISSALC